MEQKANVLIVEDNAIVAADIKSRVQALGYKVTGCVSRGEDVLEKIEQGVPSLILMDIKLKGDMTGIDAATAVRERYDIPVVYLTSYTDDDTLSQAKQTDPYGYIVKPFEDKDLKISIEISLHKHQISQELKISEQWFKTTLSSIGDGVITTDMDSKVNFMNPVAEKLTGWPLSVACGRKISEVFDIINEVTGEPVDNPVNKVIETGRIIGLANHTLLVSRDGKKVPIKDSGSPIVIDGQGSVGVVLVFQDDSEAREADRKLRESESRFRKLFENAPLPYQSLDKQGEFLEVNQTWLDILGYRKEEVIGSNFGNLLHSDWKDHFLENFTKFKSLGEVLGVEFQVRRKDGTFITAQFDGKTSSDQEGAFVQTHCVFRDISKLKALKIKVKEQDKILRQNQKLEAMGTLAGGIAHDFNNILSAVIGFTELSLDSVEKDSMVYYDLREVLTASHRAKDLVKQILTFSRKGDEEKKVLEIQPLIHETVSLLRSTVPTTIEITQHYTDDVIEIIANESQFHQVLINLITNGVHAIEGNGAIEVGVERVHLNEAKWGSFDKILSGGWAHIFVKDSGCGISAAILDSVFDPYFTTKSPDKGSGLGLSVVHGIVGSHDGHIDISSEEGKGTIVNIWLPISQRRVRGRIEKVEVNFPGGVEKLLVVDDEVAIAKLHKTILTRFGYNVSMASSSQEALDIFLANPVAFDLIVTDMTMPSLTGLQLAQSIKEIRPDIPIILCTGFSEGIEQRDTLPSSLDGILMKPVERGELLGKVRELLDSRC